MRHPPLKNNNSSNDNLPNPRKHGWQEYNAMNITTDLATALMKNNLALFIMCPYSLM